MDRKQNVDQTGPRRLTNGPSSRMSSEMKKVNRNEENYFEGTGGAKNKKVRKPRPEAGPPLAPPVPSGFNVISAPGRSGPPPVNAWSQKKGSALFNKGPPVLEDDEIMQLVKKESLKTLAEYRKRQQERMLMMSAEPPPLCFGDEPDVELETEEHPQNTVEVNPADDSYGDSNSPIDRTLVKTTGTSNSSSRFESESDEELSPERMSKPFQLRKPTTPPTPDVKRVDSSLGQHQREHKNVDFDDGGRDYSDTDDRFSPTGAEVANSGRPLKSGSVPIKNRITDDRFSPRILSVDPSIGNAGRSYKSDTVPIKERRETEECSQRTFTVEPSFGNAGRYYNSDKSPMNERNNDFTRPHKSSTPRGMMIPERESSARKMTDLADDLKSTLTFGDTGGLFESFQRGQSKLDPPNVEDVDLFLHNVIRHEPPSVVQNSSLTIEQDGIFQLDDSPKVVAADIKTEAQNDPDSNSLLDFGNVNGQASSPLSESSSSQSPLGSLGNQPFNFEASLQASPPPNQFPFPFNFSGHQELGNSANQSMMAHMAAAYMRGFIPPTGAMPGMFPTINPMTGQTQFMPSMMMPPMPGQGMYQQMALCNYYAQMAMMQNQIRPEQGSSSETHQNTADSNPQGQPLSESSLKIPEHTQILQNLLPQQQFQIQAQNQPQQNPNMAPLDCQMSQEYQSQQAPQIPQMPQNPPPPQNLPINQNQQVPQNAMTHQQTYQMNHNQPILLSQQDTPPTQQTYQIDQQVSQIPQNALNLPMHQMNRDQQTSQNTSNLQEAYPMNQQAWQNPSNLLQNNCVNQDQQMPLYQPSPLAPIPQTSLPQFHHYQAQPQTVSITNTEHNLNSNQANEYPLQQQPVPSDGNQAPQPRPGKNREDAMMKYHQALQTISQIHQEMGVQLSVPMPIPVAVPGCYPHVPQPHYLQMEPQMGHVQSSHASSVSGSPLTDGNESSESREQAAPPYAPSHAPTHYSPVQFFQLPQVAPRGRGMGRLP